MAYEVQQQLASQTHSLVAVVVFSRGPSQKAPKWPFLRRIIKTLRRRISPKDSVLRLQHFEACFEHQARAYFEGHARPPQDWPDEAAIYRTNTVRSAEFISWLEGQKIDLLCVAGGPILKDEVLQVPKLGAINMHSSILPAFRGTQAEFWQVHNDAYDRAGITIHKIDAGVDTGAILTQESLNLATIQSPQMIRAKNQLLALEFLPKVAADMLNGTIQSIAQSPDETTTTFRGKDRTIQARWQVITKLLQNGIRP